MTKFRDGFMMKSPLPKHQQKFLDKARELSEKSGTPGDYDRDNPEVREQLDKAEEAEKSHKNDGPIKMATASYRRTPMDTETYYGGEIDVPDITSVGTLAGGAIASLESGGEKGGGKSFETAVKDRKNAKKSSDSGSGGGGGMDPAMLIKLLGTLSDRRTKKNIKQIGRSPSGLKIYSFEYKHKEGVYQGVMSDEIPSNAVVKNFMGYFDAVDYSKIDVDFKKIK